MLQCLILEKKLEKCLGNKKIVLVVLKQGSEFLRNLFFSYIQIETEIIALSIIWNLNFSEENQTSCDTQKKYGRSFLEQHET